MVREMKEKIEPYITWRALTPFLLVIVGLLQGGVSYTLRSQAEGLEEVGLNVQRIQSSLEAVAQQANSNTASIAFMNQRAAEDRAVLEKSREHIREVERTLDRMRPN